MELEKIEIRHVMEHYEAFVNGKFVVSGDTFNEVLEDLRKMGMLYDKSWRYLLVELPCSQQASSVKQDKTCSCSIK